MKCMVFVIASFAISQSAYPQTMIIHKSDHSTISLHMYEIDSITYSAVPNQALQFNGTSDYVRLPSGSSLTSFGTHITIEAWIKTLGSGGGLVIASGNENEYTLAILPSGKVGATMVNVNPQTDALFIGRATLATNNWYHIAVTYDGAMETILINGIIDTAFSTSGNISSAQIVENISLGCYSATNHTLHNTFLNGLLDEVRIWNVTRTPGQIQSTINAELSGSEPGLVGYWRLNGDAKDASPNGNHGTIFGSPTFADR
ncbi:hypothetical protein BAC2_03220 [uncultured bacterium]|nr:hypothetical protein BAC2_03220 [uncultured bacterium]